MGKDRCIPDTVLDKSFYPESIPPEITDDDIGKAVFPGIKDNGKKADAIICLGCPSANKVRVPHAVKLFFDGRAERIVMSGGVFRDGECEADRMKEQALLLGVPEDAILLDRLSLTTADNMLGSLLELSRTVGLKDIHSVIIVTADFHMPRALLLAEKFIPDFIEVIPSPAKSPKDEKTWVGSELEQTVRGEFRGMYYCSDIKGGYGWWSVDRVFGREKKEKKRGNA